MFKRLWNSCKFIGKKSFAVLTLIYAVLGFVRMFVALEGFFPKETPMGYKVVVSVLILLGGWLLCVIGVSVWVLFRRKKKVIDGRNGKGVYVLYGDLFDERIVPKSVKRRNICFAVNRCFDTMVDDNLISSATLHGIALKSLYDAGIYTPKTLDNAIQLFISPAAGFEMLTPQQKPQGNLKRYEVGTTVDVPVSDKLHYFMVGVSAFNAELKAETSRSQYCLAIQRTIEFCDSHAQGYPVIMPIIGSFLSRTGQSEQDLLRYIIKCFELNRDHINQDIYIVVRKGAKNAVSIVDL